MRFGFNTFPFSSFPTLLPTYALDHAIAAIAGAGYDAVEIGCCAPHAWPAHLSGERRRAIRRLAEADGIAISSLLPAIGGGFGCNPCSSLPEERDAAAAHYREIVDLAADVGAPRVLYIGGWRAEGMTPDEGWALSLDALRDVAEHARTRGIRIAVEPTGADTNLIDTVGDAKRMMRESGCGNVDVMLDTIHVAAEGRTLSSAVSEAGADLSHLHLADTGRTALGDGDMNWDDLLGALVAADFRGTLVVETGFSRRGIDPHDVARRSLSFLRERLAALDAAGSSQGSARQSL